MKARVKKINLDQLGITASTLCAIHCAALPFLITVLPMWGIGFLANEGVEISMIVISLIIGVWSLGSTYIKQHRNLWPLIILMLGFAFIAAGHFLANETFEPILIPLGGFTIAIAHFVNLRLRKSCPIKHQHD